MDSWEYLFDRAMDALDSIDRALFPQPQWTFGGGTALMLRYRHRVSKDIDIFVDGPQWLSVLSPRLNDTTDMLSRDYVEDTMYLKLALVEGEIDFIAAPLLTRPGAIRTELRGRVVSVETPTEIVAKKLHFRGTRLRPRDVIDLAVVCNDNPRNLSECTHLWEDQISGILDHLSSLRPTFEDESSGLALLPPGEAVRSRALQIAMDFLGQ